MIYGLVFQDQLEEAKDIHLFFVNGKHLGMELQIMLGL
jgi:hypothetical protein